MRCPTASHKRSYDRRFEEALVYVTVTLRDIWRWVLRIKWRTSCRTDLVPRFKRGKCRLELRQIARKDLRQIIYKVTMEKGLCAWV